jgi:hypothetical protein
LARTRANLRLLFGLKDQKISGICIKKPCLTVFIVCTYRLYVIFIVYFSITLGYIFQLLPRTEDFLFYDRLKQRLQWYGHVQRMEEGRLPKEVMKWRAPGRAGWFGDRIPVGKRYYAPVQTGREAQPACYQWVPGLSGGTVAGAWR